MLGVSFTTSLNSNLCAAPTTQNATENNRIISHKTQLHLSPMYFNCNSSVTGHRHGIVGVLQRQQPPRSPANSSVRINSDYPGSLNLAISGNLISNYFHNHHQQQQQHNSRGCALASSVVFRNISRCLVSLLRFLKLTFVRPSVTQSNRRSFGRCALR